MTPAPFATTTCICQSWESFSHWERNSEDTMNMFIETKNNQKNITHTHMYIYIHYIRTYLLCIFSKYLEWKQGFKISLIFCLEWGTFEIIDIYQEHYEDIYIYTYIKKKSNNDTPLIDSQCLWPKNRNSTAISKTLSPIQALKAALASSSCLALGGLQIIALPKTSQGPQKKCSFDGALVAVR